MGYTPVCAHGCMLTRVCCLGCVVRALLRSWSRGPGWPQGGWRLGAVGILQTHPHIYVPPCARMQMCPLDFIPIHAGRGSVFRSGWTRCPPSTRPLRLRGYLSQLGPCCSLSGDNSTEFCLGLVTSFLSWNRRPYKPTLASVPSFPGLQKTPTSGSPHFTFPGRQQDKRWGHAERG